jgi:hypothetical protein
MSPLAEIIANKILSQLTIDRIGFFRRGTIFLERGEK